MDTELVLVRHAQSVPPTVDGPDELHRPLTPAGLRAAAELARALRALRPTAVVSSPYRRAVQTVEPVGLPVATAWELREWDSGVPPSPDWLDSYRDSWAWPWYARPGGESLDALTARAVAALRGLAHRHAGGVTVVGSHGTFVSRALLGFGHPVDFAFWLEMPMPAVYRLRFGPEPLRDPVALR